MKDKRHIFSNCSDGNQDVRSADKTNNDSNACYETQEEEDVDFLMMAIDVCAFIHYCKL